MHVAAHKACFRSNPTEFCGTQSIGNEIEIYERARDGSVSKIIGKNQLDTFYIVSVVDETYFKQRVIIQLLLIINSSADPNMSRVESYYFIK